MPKTKRIDHVSIAVRNPEEAITFFKEVFGATYHGEFSVEDEGYRGFNLSLGESGLELLAPLDEQGFVARFLDKRGGGVHHVTVQVENIDEVIKVLAGRGIKVFGRHDTPKVKEAFIYPKQAYGVLIQLIEGSFKE